MMKFDDKKFIAEKIKYMADLSDQHLSRIERGCYTPSLTTFFLLVKILKMDLKEFGFDITETANPTKNKLIDLINKANDYELVFFNDVITSLDNALKKVRKNFHNHFFM